MSELQLVYGYTIPGMSVALTPNTQWTRRLLQLLWARVTAARRVTVRTGCS